MKKTLHWNTCARVIGRLKTIFLPSANSIETPINLTIVSNFRKILFAKKKTSSFKERPKTNIEN